MNNEDELYHYGVMGMKWGKRKAQGSIKPTTDGSSLKAYRQAIANRKAAKDMKKVKQAAYSKMYDRASGAFGFKKDKMGLLEKTALESGEADKQYKAAKKAEKAAKKMAKAEAKEVKRLYREEFMKGKSAVGRLISKINATDKAYADFAYSMTDGKYVKGDYLLPNNKKQRRR